MPSGFLLDTNALSDLISGQDEKLRRRFKTVPINEIRISALTRGEIEYGIAKRPEAKRRAQIAADLFDLIDVLPWTSQTALVYGRLRLEIQRAGKALGPLDMLIAAQAMEVDAVLVTRDRAFRHVPGLQAEDWSQD